MVQDRRRGETSFLRVWNDLYCGNTTFWTVHKVNVFSTLFSFSLPGKRQLLLNCKLVNKKMNRKIISLISRGLSFIFFSLSNSRNQSFHLQVLERKSLGCFQPGDSVKHLLVNVGGDVPCPGWNCSDNTDAIWYKMKHKVV